MQTVKTQCQSEFSLAVVTRAAGLLLVSIAIFCSPSPVSAEVFSVPTDLALRIRLDDTLTSVDYQVGDPFSATVLEEGEYRNPRVYGHLLRSTCQAD